MKIHPTALVDAGAQLADDVEVQAYTIVGPHVRIDSGTIVGPHCVIEGRTVIGKNNQFFSGAQVGVLSQDLKHNPAFTGRTVIGDNNQIREHVTISASTIGSEEEKDRITSIGSNCLFMACAHVAHECHVGDYVIMANQVALGGHVRLEDRVIIGGLSGVHQFCQVGKLCMVGGLTRIWSDAPPYMIIDGNPARCTGPNIIGLRRRGISPEGLKRIKQMYKIVYRSNLNVTQALAKIESTVDECEERAYFLAFVRKSGRGIGRG